VNFAAKNEYDLLNNWKVIQSVFTAQGISKPIDVAKLVKGKTQDNLEFAQWFKTFFDSKHDGSPYPAREKRAALGKKPAVVKQAPTTEKKGLKQPTATPAPKAKVPAVIAKPIKPQQTATPTPTPTPVKPKIAPPAVKKAPTPTPAPVEAEAEAEPEQQQSPPVEEKINVEEYNATLAMLRETIEGLEKERNFYFQRLQAVEVYCQKDQNDNPIAKRDILAILYTEDAPAEGSGTPQRRTSQPESSPQPQQTVPSQNEVILDDGLLDAGAADGDLTSF
jgi:RP/EB family microtubule-associated protein